jgi:ribosomal protein L37E
VPSGHDDGEKTRTHERCARIAAQVRAKRCAHPIFGTTNRADGGMRMRGGNIEL